MSDAAGPTIDLDLYAGDGSGDFTYTSTYFTGAHPTSAYSIGFGSYTGGTIYGLVAGNFTGAGLDLAVPVQGDGAQQYVDVVPLSSDGVWKPGLMLPLPNDTTQESDLNEGDIVAADLNGSGKLSIAVTNGDSGEVWLYLADPASNQLLPSMIEMGASDIYGGTYYGMPVMLATGAFDGTAATPGYRGPTSDPSTLVQNEDGTWTQTYPDGTVIGYNTDGQEVSEADPDGNTWTYAYVPGDDPGAGSLETITDPVGLVTTLTYNDSGYLATIVDPADRVTTITINDAGNLTEIEDPDGNVTEYGYADNHEMTTETNPDGGTATAHYNSFGQATGETLFDGTSNTYVDSAQSRGLLAPGGSGPLPTTYEGSVTDPDGYTTTVGFNWMSHPISETDGTGAATVYTHTSQGFVASMTEPDESTIYLYTYDDEGDVTSTSIEYDDSYLGFEEIATLETETYGVDEVPTSITDGDGNTTTYTLDDNGNVLTESDPDGDSEHFTYNSAGQVLTDEDANGYTTSYAYDSYGRLTTITYPGAGSPTTTIAYDSAGDITSETNQDGDTTYYTYDADGNVTSEANAIQHADGKATSYTYDGDGNLTSVTDPLGNVTTYTYNDRNELIGMTDADGGHTTYGYDASGNLISVTDPRDGEATYAYDADNRETGMTDADGGRTTYVYDSDGEETSVTDPNGNETEYTYNDLLQLQTETLPPGGGATEINDNPVGMLVTSTVTFAYDLDNNLIGLTDGDGDTTTYTYNAMNEESSVTDGDGDVTSYTYDGDGNQTTVTDPARLRHDLRLQRPRRACQRNAAVGRWNHDLHLRPRREPLDCHRSRRQHDDVYLQRRRAGGDRDQSVGRRVYVHVRPRRQPDRVDRPRRPRDHLQLRRRQPGDRRDLGQHPKGERRSTSSPTRTTPPAT